MNNTSPFRNDPFVRVCEAYKRLYNKPCEIYWDQHINNDPKHENEYGYTIFPSDNTIPEIYIFAEHSVNICIETLAHELAHVAVGVEHEHDSIWDEAFEKIRKEYDKIGTMWFEDERSHDS